MPQLSRDAFWLLWCLDFLSVHLDEPKLTVVLIPGCGSLGHWGSWGSCCPRALAGKPGVTGAEMEAQDSDFLPGPYRYSGSGGGLWDTGTRKGEKGFLPSFLPPSLELLPKGSKEEQRDYVFYLAVGSYRLKVRRRAPSAPPPRLGGRAPPRLSPPSQRCRVIAGC